MEYNLEYGLRSVGTNSMFQIHYRFKIYIVQAIFIHIIEPCGFNINDSRFKRVVMDYMDLDKIAIHQSAEKFFEANKIKFIRANVGDRYVKEQMQKNNFNLGGEQSGHIILGKFATTGDGK